MTLSGSQAQINAALATVQYTSDNGTTADTLTILSTDGTSLTDSDVINIAVGNTADLVTVKTLTSGDATPNEGDTVTFQIAVTNNGAAQATNVSLTDALPAGLTLTGNSPSQGSYNTGSGLWSIGTLNSGAGATLTLSGTVDAGEGGNTITNSTTAATGDQPDPTTSGDDLNEAVVVDNSADLELVTTVDNLEPRVGSVITYTITLTNNGPDEATNINVTENLPTELTGMTITPNDGTAYDNNSNVWSIASLANGASVTLTVSGTVNNTTGLTNSAEITAVDQHDPDSIPDNDADFEDDQDSVSPVGLRRCSRGSRTSSRSNSCCQFQPQSQLRIRFPDPMPGLHLNFPPPASSAEFFTKRFFRHLSPISLQ